MRITFFLASFFLLFSVQQLNAQSKPDLLYLTDGSVERVVIRGESNSRKLIQYHPWQGGRDQILTKEFSSIQKIVYSYGVERVFNESFGEEEGSILDDIFGGVDDIEEEVLSVPEVENTTLLLTDETNAKLVDYSWTYERLKLLRPSRYQKTRRSRRSRYSSSRQRIPQWEQIDMDYVQGILVPGRVRLHVMGEGATTINDSTGWVELRNGLRYAAQSIEIRDMRVTFEEYYTRKVFQWDLKDVDFLVWEYNKGSIDFLVPGEVTMDDSYRSESSRGDGYEDDGSTNIDDLFNSSGGGGGISGGGGSGTDDGINNKVSSSQIYNLKGLASEFSPLIFPVKEPSSLLRLKINASRVSTSSRDYSLFPKSNTAYTVEDVRNKLNVVFDSKNYKAPQYFPIKGGFVMLIPVEKFQEDGSSASWYERFNIQAEAAKSKNFRDMLQNISFKDPGYYRMFAVVVSDDAKTYGGTSSISIDGTEDLGKRTLDMPLNSKHKATFMVYEWNQIKSGEKASLKERGENKYSMFNHLKKAGIWAEIQK